MKQKQISILVGMLCSSAMPAVWAAAAEAKLDDVVVIADRTEQSIDKTAANVSVINRKGLDKAGATDIRTAVRYEPGVEVNRDARRQGNAGYNIRGIDGNRILMMIDGVRLPEAYTGGGTSGAISGRDMIEFDTLRQMDIVKGPYSSLYGSDALGGAVNFATYRPSDFVDEEKPWYLGLKQSYNSANKGHATTLTAAGQQGITSGLLMMTKRKADEFKNRGSNDSHSILRTKPNPQDISGHNILAKGVLAEGAHRLEASAEWFKRTTDTDILNYDVNTAMAPGKLANTAEDEVRRQRLGLTYTYQPLDRFFDEIEVGLSRQKLESKDTAKEYFGGNVAQRMVFSDYDFNQTIDTLHAQGKARFQQGSITHAVTAGIELKQNETDRLTKKYTTRPGSEPVMTSNKKTFPDTKRKTIGVYVQDAITFESGVRLTPALRYTYERITPYMDEAYLASTPNVMPERFSDSAVSPSISLSVPLSPTDTGFVTYSTGFRAPPFDSSMMSMANQMGSMSYQILPNPNLKSEKSQSIEVGLRHKSQDFEGKVTTFYNRYRDFIGVEDLGKQVIDGQAYDTSRYANIGKVTTYGVEASGAYRIAHNWQLNGAASWMRGTNKSTDAPLESVAPPKLILGVGYDTAVWGANLDWTLSAKHKRVSDKSKYVQAPGYGIVDLTGYWQINKHAKLNVGVYNLGDKKYWEYLDIRNYALSGVPYLDFNSQVGRNVAASLQIKF
ncbi:MAG: TonB-dependent hemoglobin/transferrin/lactoferrin family receptor [Neisseriaceae bacterium]|nr:TonB-dependent hemoglobin/transferrin/lactoferrin family receptor [Neisseriaceae bacterium]